MIDKSRHNLPRVQVVQDLDTVQLYDENGEALSPANVGGKTPGLFKQTLTAGNPGYFVINPNGNKMGSVLGIKTKSKTGISGLTKVDVVLEEYWDDDGWAENPTYTYELSATTAVKGLTFYPLVEGLVMPSRLKVTMTGGGGVQYCQVVMG